MYESILFQQWKCKAESAGIDTGKSWSIETKTEHIKDIKFSGCFIEKHSLEKMKIARRDEIVNARPLATFDK